VAILELDAELATESPRFAEKCDDSNHHMGGMRMDPSPLRGVVDTDLKIHGNENCYVCSSAVFPTSGFSNPTHTLLALAMRLAEHLTALPREG
jgi:choline dehydrogenase-like flavoprotein